MVLDDKPCDVCLPTDYYTHLIKSTLGRRSIIKDTHIYEKESDRFRYNIKRCILAPGFELSVAQYSFEKEITQPYRLGYEGIEISALFREDKREPVRAGYLLRFFDTMNEGREYLMTFPRNRSINVNLFLDKSWLQNRVDLNKIRYSNRNVWQELKESYRNRFVSVVHEIISMPLEYKGNSLFLESKCLELSAIVISDMESKLYKQFETVPGLTYKDMNTLNKAKAIIERHCLQNPSITNIAKEVGLNANKLMQEYKMAFGTTIHNDIVYFRMKHALASLRIRGMTVSETAAETGYAHQGHFIRAFRRYFGATPGEVRKAADTKR